MLKARESKLPGTVLLLFQPAEEGGAGGKFMVDEGIMEGVLGVHGIHVWPHLPSGTISTRVSANQLISATKAPLASKIKNLRWQPDKRHEHHYGSGGLVSFGHTALSPV